MLLQCSTTCIEIVAALLSHASTFLFLPLRYVFVLFLCSISLVVCVRHGWRRSICLMFLLDLFFCLVVVVFSSFVTGILLTSLEVPTSSFVLFSSIVVSTSSVSSVITGILKVTSLLPVTSVLSSTSTH